MIQQFLRLPRVFTSDQLHFFAQHAHRAQRNVFQIADRRGDDIESAGQALEVYSKGGPLQSATGFRCLRQATAPTKRNRATCVSAKADGSGATFTTAGA